MTCSWIKDRTRCSMLKNCRENTWSFPTFRTLSSVASNVMALITAIHWSLHNCFWLNCVYYRVMSVLWCTMQGQGQTWTTRSMDSHTRGPKASDQHTRLNTQRLGRFKKHSELKSKRKWTLCRVTHRNGTKGFWLHNCPSSSGLQVRGMHQPILFSHLWYFHFR